MLLFINECHSSRFVVSHVAFVLLIATALRQLESFLFGLLFFVDLVDVCVWRVDMERCAKRREGGRKEKEGVSEKGRRRGKKCRTEEERD